MRALEMLVRDDERRTLTMKLAALRACASNSEYVAYRRRQLPIYRVLEEELDAQVAVDAQVAAPTTGLLRDFSSLTGAAAAVWDADLRRAPALDAELKALTGRSFTVDEDLLPPAVRQYVRRIRAAATLNGDLLLGHVFARYVVDLEPDVAPWMRAVGYKSPPDVDVAKLKLAIAAAAEHLDDDAQIAIVLEAKRSFDLNVKVLTERGDLFFGALPGAFKVAQARLFQRATSPPLS